MNGQTSEMLSMREQEVVAAYVDGQSYKEIARNLGIAPATVRTHLRTVYRKLGVTSRSELAQAQANHAGTGTRRSDADLVAELALELDEAMRRERIFARVLRIISKQGDDLDGVVDAVLDHALKICEAEFGILFEYRGDLRFRAMRTRNIAPGFGDWLAQQGVFSVGADTGLGRLVSRRATVNIADVRGEDTYRAGVPLRLATADLGHARSFVAIPMIWGERLLGAFTIYRTRVHPFNDRALELAQLFSDQAAIAIENARRQTDG
ncbi:MAG: LuxR C-terminal-related transcriptional regulator [Rhodobacteraceae bacterium]|nr:LuxR C-terminal-related transcriptional regulator [Paracoccaceae bacterium]